MGSLVCGDSSESFPGEALGEKRDVRLDPGAGQLNERLLEHTVDGLPRGDTPELIRQFLEHPFMRLIVHGRFPSDRNAPAE